MPAHRGGERNLEPGAHAREGLPPDMRRGALHLGLYVAVTVEDLRELPYLLCRVSLRRWRQNSLLVGRDLPPEAAAAHPKVLSAP